MDGIILRLVPLILRSMEVSIHVCNIILIDVLHVFEQFLRSVTMKNFLIIMHATVQHRVVWMLLHRYVLPNFLHLLLNVSFVLLGFFLILLLVFFLSFWSFVRYLLHLDVSIFGRLRNLLNFLSSFLLYLILLKSLLLGRPCFLFYALTLVSIFQFYFPFPFTKYFLNSLVESFVLLFG